MLADIEGVTPRWRSSAVEPTDAAVSTFYEQLEAAIALQGGVRPTEQQDDGSAVAAFARPSDALAAALQIQRAFNSGKWPEVADLRLRIALHTSEAQSHDEGNYFGKGVSRCARLRGIAHGGQVLMSAATHDLVQDRLPEGVAVKDLGVHRLRDLGRPEQVFSVQHPDLPDDFPPLRSLDSVPNNLPGGLTTFVGRRAELAEVGQLLSSVRLLTLIGAGGCGKTRLALQAAANSTEHYPDGVWLVELARLDDPQLLAAAVMAATGVPELAAWHPLDALLAYLKERRGLVLLDNCEHLLDASAELVECLLHECRGLTVLATSRAPLEVPGETPWRVPSMSLPSESHREPIEVLAQSDAVRLFIDRALRVRPNFGITITNAPWIAQICHDLDGIPLAIELAAARMRMMEPEQIAHALGDRFHLLTGGSRTVMPRQQTLEASIDWSHELLTQGERTLLRRLSVFSDGWTLDAAERVCICGEIACDAVLNLLTGLLDKSLITTAAHGAEMRYGLLRSVRQYARARLNEAGESKSVAGHHLEYYLGLAERVEPQLLTAGRGDPVLRILTDEMPNLRSALEFAASTEPTAALRLANSLQLFWLFTGRYREGDAAYATALEATGEEPTPLQGRVLCGRSHLAIYAGLYAEAPVWAKAALQIGEACGDLTVQARAYDVLGSVYGVIHPPAGPPLLNRSVELATEAGDDWCRIDALQFLGWCWIFQDAFDSAYRLLDEAHEAAERIGYRWGNAMHWLELSRIAKLEGRLDEAEEFMAKMIDASNDVGDPVTLSMAAHALTWIAVERGRWEAAKGLIRDPLHQVTEAEAGIAVGFANQVMARAELGLGNFTAARRHLEVAIEADRLRLAYFLAEHLSLLGTLDRIEGDHTAALEHGKEALGIGKRIGSPWLQSFAERLLSRLALAAGDKAVAERYAQDALGHLASKGLELSMPECLDILAAIAAGEDRFEDAARLLGAAEGGRSRLRAVRVPPETEFWSALEMKMREALNDDVFAAAFAAGAEMETSEAVGYARRTYGERKRPSLGWASLTPTELEVARHVAQGLTNVQIGKRMFIARGTVKVHLSHIFPKLGFSSRSQLAAEAVKREVQDIAG